MLNLTHIREGGNDASAPCRRRIGVPLFQDERAIGSVAGTAVSFRGFATSDDAMLAASVAHRALAQRRAKQLGSERGTDAPTMDHESTLLAPASEPAEMGGWGFEIALLPTERGEVFALARARVIWRALQGTGISRRMEQFTHGLASA